MIKHSITPAVFCALLIAAACEKIDEADFATSAGSNDTGQSGTQTDTPRNDMLQEQPDGSLLMPAEQHAVALSELTAEGDECVLYISLCEWGDIVSAYSATDNGMAADIASKYVEGDISGWHIPTKEEAAQLKKQYAAEATVYPEALLTLNSTISRCGGVELRPCELKDSYPAYRYLCEDATYSFSIKTGSNVTKAGAKTKYHLRLVKDSIIVNY